MQEGTQVRSLSTYFQLLILRYCNQKAINPLGMNAVQLRILDIFATSIVVYIVTKSNSYRLESHSN